MANRTPKPEKSLQLKPKLKLIRAGSPSPICDLPSSTNPRSPSHSRSRIFCRAALRRGQDFKLGRPLLTEVANRTPKSENFLQLKPKLKLIRAGSPFPICDLPSSNNPRSPSHSRMLLSPIFYLLSPISYLLRSYSSSYPLVEFPGLAN